MADKTTTLKTKTNDNVYPKVIGESRKDSFADSSTITHHFYDKTHKVGFQIANETNIKIQNSLQKPKGLTKTELVGVGTNGQENIEIGDNLTLANGKLSATVGGSGGEQIGVLSYVKEYTIEEFQAILDKGLIALGNSYALQSNDEEGHIYGLPFVYTNENNPFLLNINEFIGTPQFNDDYTKLTIGGEFKTFTINSQLNYHFITLSHEQDTIYFQILTSYKEPYDIDIIKDYLSGMKIICTGHIGNSDETKADPKFISGESGGLEVYYVLQNDTSGTITSKSVTSYTISDLVTPLV